MYCIMTICSIEESGPSSSNTDGDDNTNLKIPKLSEVLSVTNVCRHYNSAKHVKTLINLQNEIYALNTTK